MVLMGSGKVAFYPRRPPRAASGALERQCMYQREFQRWFFGAAKRKSGALSRKCAGTVLALITVVEAWDLDTAAKQTEVVEAKRLRNLLFTRPTTPS